MLDPAELLAVTASLTVLPISLVSSPSVVPVAPVTSLHSAPPPLQSSHW